MSAAPLIVETLDEEIVEADLAELVDDHRGIPQRGIAKQTEQQRRLAHPRKPVSSATGVKAGRSLSMAGLQLLEQFWRERIAEPPHSFSAAGHR